MILLTPKVNFKGYQYYLLYILCIKGKKLLKKRITKRKKRKAFMKAWINFLKQKKKRFYKFQSKAFPIKKRQQIK